MTPQLWGYAVLFGLATCMLTAYEIVIAIAWRKPWWRCVALSLAFVIAIGVASFGSWHFIAVKGVIMHTIFSGVFFLAGVGCALIGGIAGFIRSTKDVPSILSRKQYTKKQ